LLAACSIAAAGSPAAAADPSPPAVVRIATFNASLNRPTEGALRRELASPGSAQPAAVAEIVQRVRPDILLLQEFDFDAAGAAIGHFQSNYLGVSQNGQEPLHYPHVYFTESNTGQPSGLDLNNDGQVGGGQDALGFGEFPGQYAMVLLSRFPIDAKRARTFRRFLWRNLPGAKLPDDPATAAAGDWYSPEELAVLPLSSKNHWDVPVKIGRLTLHVLASHPTPPAFDGPEDRNGLRNHDEIRFWTDYLSPRGSGYLRDDRGRRGGLPARANFIVMGDLNSDPVDGASLHEGIRALLDHPRVNADRVPSSPGALEASETQGGINTRHAGDSRFDTADFSDGAAGNLRADYLLPSRGLTVCRAGVFWPRRTESGAELVWGDRPPPSSDHRLVWMDVSPGAAKCPPDNDPTASAPSRPGR
jgi:endonuclease/exonuclease/phosphatase family metal-dependent hydrolase